MLTQLQAGRDVNLKATNDLTLIGTQVKAVRDIDLNVGHDLAAGANEALVAQLDSLVRYDENLLTMSSQLVGIAVAAASNGDVQQGADIAKAATQYNYLSHDQDRQKNKEIQECGDSTTCEVGVSTKWALISAQQNVGIAVGVGGGIGLSAAQTADGLYELAKNLPETIALVAKKGGKHDKALSQAGQDFFSLLLKQDKEGLQALIEGQAKIKSAQELEGQFLAGFAVIHAKLCWHRGIEVQIQNPLVPMPLMPIQPLDAYDVEYDFLRPDWTPPPPPGLLAKVKRLFSQ